MNLSENLLFFFSAVGVFNGILLSLYFLFFIRPKKVVNLFFGLLILMLCVRIGKSVFYYFFRDISKIYLQIGLSGCLFIGPFLFFYLEASLHSINQFQRSQKIQLCILIFFITVVGFIFPYSTRPDLWNTYFSKSIYFVWMSYLLASMWLFRIVLKKLLIPTQKLTTLEYWLLIVFVANFVICAWYHSAMYWSGKYYIYGPLSFSILFYVLLLFLLFHKNKKEIFFTTASKYALKKIDTDVANQLLEKLNTVISNQEIYKNAHLKLQDVAQSIDIPPHQLSQLLNDNLGKNFSQFINEHRINQACHLIATQHHLTLEGIGSEVGFNSKSTFYATFKKNQGMTPAKYKQQILSN